MCFMCSVLDHRKQEAKFHKAIFTHSLHLYVSSYLAKGGGGDGSSIEYVLAFVAELHSLG